ncbi:MAG: VIT domain-containing protein, partial [Myxococcota bacterium]|nr:VIT domain-containing protein [Myxococcota bacterium]
LETLYVFPLPDGASVDSLDVIVGDRQIHGEVQERALARALYQAAAKGGHAAALVERVRPGVFRSAVANVPPRAEVVVRIAYQRTADVDGRNGSLRFPTALLPTWRADASDTPPSPTVETDPFSVDILLAPGAPLHSVSSPSHSIRRKREAPERYRIELATAQTKPGRDFVLRWRTRQADTPAARVFRESTRSGHYQLLVLNPPVPGQRSLRVPSDTIFVIDISSSMSGPPLRAARTALVRALRHLPDGDTFHLLAFDDELHPWRPSSEPMLMTADTRRLAVDWARSLETRGGTDIQQALASALARGSPPGHNSRVVLLTDGGASYDADTLQRLRDALGDRRILVIGLGLAPNGYLLRRIATLGRGTFLVVDDLDDLDDAIDRVVGPGSLPLLSDLEVHAAGDVEIESWPDILPDLFAGRSLFVAIQSSEPDPVLTVRARRDGVPIEVHPPGASRGTGIARDFAARKIDTLELLYDEFGTSSDEREALRAVILETALDEGVVSRFTSLVAIDEEPTRSDEEELVALSRRAPLPENWHLPASFRDRAQSALAWSDEWTGVLVAADRFLTAEERRVVLGVRTGTNAQRNALLGTLVMILALIVLIATVREDGR